MTTIADILTEILTPGRKRHQLIPSLHFLSPSPSGTLTSAKRCPPQAPVPFFWPVSLTFLELRPRTAHQSAVNSPGEESGTWKLQM